MEKADIKPQIHLRLACESDRETVLSFCKRTWCWGDYIPDVWKDWLNEKDGRLFVATIANVPVGMVHLKIEKANQMWLSGARTDRKYRRMGIATALTQKCLKYGKSKGATVTRLATRADNKISRAAVEKMGFTKVAAFFCRVNRNINAEKSEGSRWAQIHETEKIWGWLQASKTSRKKTFYTVADRYLTFAKDDLSEFVKQKKTVLHENADGELDGIMLVDDEIGRERREKSIQTCYVEGVTDAIKDMTRFLKNHCLAMGLKKIYAFAPNNKKTISAFEEVGFKRPTSIEVVYEKRL